MKKVIVIGCPGSGKTTFAEKLCDKTGLPLYYLDAIWHKPDKTHISRDDFDARLGEILALESWIIDGNYSRTLERRMAACDTVILFDLHKEVCLEGAMARLGKGRYDMPWMDSELDPKLKVEIEEFGSKNLPAIYSLLDKYKNGREIVIFKSREEADKFMTNGLIERAQAYVREKFENEYSGHDYFHTLRVFKMAARIAESEGANSEIVQLAALLHDVDDRKISPETYKSQANARNFLVSNGVDDNTIELICQIIREISFGANNSVPTTLEGQCVQDADRLDAIGAVGIARAFAYGGNHSRHMYHPDIKPNLNMTKEEYVKSESTTINHLYEKLFKLTALMNTKTAIQIAKARESYMQEFVAEFMDEWDGVR